MKAMLLEGSKVRIRCPQCGSLVLVIKTVRKNNHQFLGCANYPICRHTQPIPESVKLWALGFQPLPGFEEAK